MSPSKVRCSILGFNPVLFNDSILMKISLEFPGALPKGPVMCPVLSPCTRSDRSTLRAPLSWALQRPESRRTEWLSLAQGHWTTGHARFKERVPSWLRRGMGKNREEVEIFIFPQHRGRKKSSPFPANEGESTNSRTLFQELLLGISSRGQSGISRKKSNVVHFQEEKEGRDSTCWLPSQPPNSYTEGTWGNILGRSLEGLEGVFT